jgi:uncharacterized protein
MLPTNRVGTDMAAIVTPCKSVCILAPATDLCRGCGRTLAEIAGWGTMTDRQRTAVMMNLPQRLRGIDNSQVREGVG